jgi:PAS domain S-box-containing protein
MKQLKKILSPPVFEDDIKTQRAYLLNILIWTLLCVPIPYVLYTFLLAPENLTRALVQSVYGEAVNIILLWMLHRGFVKAASIIQVAAFWLFFTVSAATGSGVKGEAYLIGYGLVIAIAGLLLGGRGALLLTILSVVAGGAMVYAEAQGMLVSRSSGTPLTTWIISLLLFPVGATLQYLGTQVTRQALARARASEERYRLISRVSSDYTFSTVLNAEGNMYLNWVTGALERMTGYTFDEYVATGGWQGHLYPEDVEMDERAFEQLSRNQSAILEVRTFKKDGEIVWVRVYAHPVWDEKRNKLAGIVGAVQNIDEQKRSEQALKYERDLLQIFLDNIPDTVYFKDRESRFVRINSAQARMLGVDTPQDAIGKTDRDFMTAELAEAFMEEERKIVETGEPVVNRTEFNPTRDGQLRWLSATKVPVKDMAGNVTGTIGISRNITEQKLAQEYEQNRRAILEKVLRLGQEVTEVQNFITTLKKIWHGVRNELDFDRIGIYLYDPDTNNMNGTFGTNNQGEMVDEWHIQICLDENNPEVEAFNGVLRETDGLYFTPNYESEHDVHNIPIMQGVRDFAAVAARVGDKPVAVICVDQVISGRAITNEQLEALRLFAGYAGLAIENSRLHEALQIELQQQKQAEEQEARRRFMLEKVLELGKQVTETTDLNTTLQRIWHSIHDDLNFDRLGIFLYNPEQNSVEGTYGTSRQGEMVEEWDLHIPLDVETGETAPLINVIREENGIYVTDNYTADRDIPQGHSMEGVKSYAAVAAWAGDKPIGILCVDHFTTGRIITEEQLEALRLFAGYAGLAIQNARLNATLEEDIAHRQSLIDELEAKNAELERFTYTVSHDLKSPLVTITGFLGYVEKDALAGDMARLKTNINRILKAAQKMQNLLNDLLELSRIGRLMNKPENVPFHAIVREALEHVRGQLEANQVRVEVQEALPTIRGDKIRLVEVIQNLVDNAAKFTKGRPAPLIKIGTEGTHKNGSPIFFVSDNGIGIASQYHEKIFGLFDKLDPTVEGTGVGLTLVKRIIEVHGGTIWLESQPGVGTTFYFTLPGLSFEE